MNCQHIKDTGETCKAKATKNSNYCFFHNPDLKKDRQLAVRNGGLNSKKNNLGLPKRALRTPNDVVFVIEETLNHLRGGNIHPNYSNSIFIGCNILLKALEQSEIMKRVETIEESLKMHNNQ